MGNRSKQKRSAASGKAADARERFRILGRITFDCNDREQYLAYRRMKYRINRAKTASPEGAGEAAPVQGEIP